MKRFFQFLFSLLMFAVMAGAASEGLATFGIGPAVSTLLMVGVAVLTYVQRRNVTSFVFRNDVEVEMWVGYIIERFYKDNMFLQFAHNDDEYVVGGRIVHIPQPGLKPIVVKNRSSWPGTVVRRADTDIVYVLDEYSTDPTHIVDADNVQLSYDKMDSVLGDHSGVLNETVADDILIKWLTDLPEANIIYTTGAAGLSETTGQTGNRLAMHHLELKTARKKLNRMNVPKNDRYALLTDTMYEQMTLTLTKNEYDDFSQYYDAATGVVGQLYGFNIMTRSSVAMAAADLDAGKLAVNDLDQAVSETDDEVSICWQKGSVARALGEVKFFENKQDALYQGDIYSGLIRMGGRRRRADNLGVIGIKQAKEAA